MEWMQQCTYYNRRVKSIITVIIRGYNNLKKTFAVVLIFN